MARTDEQVQVSLANAAQRRAKAQTDLRTGLITVERFREVMADEARWIDRCLDELRELRAAP